VPVGTSGRPDGPVRLRSSHSGGGCPHSTVCTAPDVTDAARQGLNPKQEKAPCGRRPRGAFRLSYGPLMRAAAPPP
ncbi:hypothetical protein PKCEKB_PKCEKB_12815, partial [Dysosmobacter welbionis]